MVKLRLRRRGRKARPVFDIVAADSRSPRDGRFIERVGQYNPLISDAPVTMLDRDRVNYWLGTGAQPSDTVRSLLSREGVLLEGYLGKKGASEDQIREAVENHQARRRSKNPKPKAKAAAPAAE